MKANLSVKSGNIEQVTDLRKENIIAAIGNRVETFRYPPQTDMLIPVKT